MQFTLSSAVPAGTALTVVDASGSAVATFTTSKQTQSVVFSSDRISNGQTYTLASGGASGTAVLGGLSTGGSAGSTVVATAVAGRQQPSEMGGGPGGDMGGAPGSGGPGGSMPPGNGAPGGGR